MNVNTRHETESRLVLALGSKLLPFFKAVLVYFTVLASDDSPEARGPSWTGVLLKVLPVLGLVLFVLLHEGLSPGLLGPECRFSRRVLLGLVLSALADALLVWPAHFLSGMAVFGAAHLMYITAFGFQPLRPTLGLALYALSAWAVSLLSPSLTGALALGVPLYSALLATMLWRAAASRPPPPPPGAAPAAAPTPAPAPWLVLLCPRAGGLLFAVSDALIGFHMFHRPVPNAQALIMATYYAAQLGLALSVVGRGRGRGGSVGKDHVSRLHLLRDKPRAQRLLPVRSGVRSRRVPE
ncbi:Lysoplasmalogenase-like protein TMEM86A [Frankliniella fusca]|uniref:lysoplasmalogenase n=1 Tax=Frankliniella fusca TaxID=407009 RepID=A0AAE1LNC0_9NEOP|nr:Lysoplasmalogenase-like protein TMEM86A [Frankliniella fusca]